MAIHQAADIDGDLADSIAMLEQILEVMPQDVLALKALYNAYAQAERPVEAFDYLCSLADAVMAADDRENAQFVFKQLDHFAADFSTQVSALRARMKPFATVTKSVSTTARMTSAPKKQERDISDELALAWRLYEDGQLSQDEYSTVLHDLTEISAKEISVPVSVLHVMNDRNFSNLSRIVNYLSARSGSPYLSLANFEVQPEAASLLPLEFAARDGLLPFAMVGDDVLVALLNPFNTALLERAETACGKRCHTFLVIPEEYDSSLGKLRELNKSASR